MVWSAGRFSGRRGVEEVDRHAVTVHPGHRVAPPADRHRATAEIDRDPRFEGIEHLFRRPVLRVLHLSPVVGERLAEEALMVDERDPHQRKPEVGGGAQMVAGENSEAPAVRRYGVVHGDLHGEIGDRRGSGGHGRNHRTTVVRKPLASANLLLDSDWGATLKPPIHRSLFKSCAPPAGSRRSLRPPVVGSAGPFRRGPPASCARGHRSARRKRSSKFDSRAARLLP